MEAAELATGSGHVIVCGLHDVGLRIVEQLHAAGERVVVVDDDPDPRLLRITAALDIPHLTGSPQRRVTLAAAGIDAAVALVCVDPDDLRNLEVALLARRLRPELRVVVQLTNLAVGRAVERVTGPGSVLDVATLAAPAFIEACLSKRSHRLDVGGAEFRVVEVVAEAHGTLRTIFGDLAPIAVIPISGSELQVCPGRDLVVVPGDRVIVVGGRDDLAERRLTGPAPQSGAEANQSGRRRISIAWRYVTSFATETERSLRLTLVTLLGLAVLSVVLLSAGYRTASGGHLGLLNSTYFTTETLTTVGFGDFSFGVQPMWLRLWAILLMVLGATLVTVVYALLTNLLVSRRIEQSLGRQQVTRMRGHVILVGLGSVGLRVLEGLLAAGQPVVVLERDENNRYLANARALDVPVVIGDSTSPGSLAAVNLRTAKAIAVLTSSDLANIETGLAVEGILDAVGANASVEDQVPIVLRVFDRQLAQTIESSFGFRHVRSTSALAAPWFVGAALGLDILSTFYVDRQPMLVGRLTVAAWGGLRGQTMLGLSARIRVIAISRVRENGRLEYPPRRDTRFDGGDQAYLVGPYEELLRVLRQNQSSQP
ncbi:MAG TPA: NAD-binding protein [Jatrophihabitantaceae bacterium]|nr:NAD-binding protein [Jatrophihabitantaceae bacterium]